MSPKLAWVLALVWGPTVASAQCYEDTHCFYTCGYGYYQHAGSLFGCTDLCCPTSYHPLHAPIIIHHTPPLIVHHSVYHAPTMAYHPTYHPASYHSTYHPSTSYHSSYHGSPTTYHRTSSYRHYLMTESPAKLRAARVATWGSSALVLVIIVVVV